MSSFPNLSMEENKRRGGNPLRRHMGLGLNSTAFLSAYSHGLRATMSHHGAIAASPPRRPRTAATASASSPQLLRNHEGEFGFTTTTSSSGGGGYGDGGVGGGSRGGYEVVVPPPPPRPLSPRPSECLSPSSPSLPGLKRRHTEGLLKHLVDPSRLKSQAQGSVAPTATTVLPAKGPLNRKDLNQFQPLKRLQIEPRCVKVYSVPNGITDETVVAAHGNKSVNFYRLKISENKKAAEAVEEKEVENTVPEPEPTSSEAAPKQKPKLLFDLIKVHEVVMDTKTVGYFAVSLDCSVTLPPRRLIYAITPFLSSVVTYFDFQEGAFIPEKIYFEREEKLVEYGASIKLFENEHVSRDMAIKGDKYLACLLQNATVVIWDIPEHYKLRCFEISNVGVHLSWHVSEASKLLVVESEGFVRFFNIERDRCYQSAYTCNNQLFCGDWSPSTSLAGVVGGAGTIITFNTSKANSNALTFHDQACKMFKRVIFNPLDSKSIASLEMQALPLTIIRFWRDHLPHHLWSYSNEELKDIAWVHGKPYIIGLGHQHIFLFDASYTT